MTTDSEFLDALETRGADAREAALFAALPAHLGAAVRAAPALADRLAGHDLASVTTRAALARLPVLRKSELLEQQRSARRAGGDALGGHAAVGWGSARPPAERAGKVFASPGPIYEPEARTADAWRMARALHAAGFRAGDLVHNAFSYHFTPAGSMMESGALALGCTVFPAGTGQTEQQLQALADLRPDAYVGTPSFLRILLDKADEAGLALPALRKASVGGEGFPPSLRDRFAARGIEAVQSYGTADLGLVAYETRAREGLVLDEHVIVEIVRPGTGEPVPEGEVGEVVVTPLSAAYPLVRFGTGDLSAILPGACPTGRTAPRIRGWLGRADQSAKVRGLFVHPAQVAEIARRHPELVRLRLVVSGADADDRLLLRAETAGAAPEGLAAQVVQAVRDITKLRAEVELVPAGTLPNDGKVIDDARPPPAA